ncbi:TonB-dependent receptor [Novosphingobium sp.]|uniref:TonB-dependent receptor n=1 Tax=Novosphingobium sp. TaxID=1874826 RepID=UPI0035AFE134
MAKHSGMINLARLGFAVGASAIAMGIAAPAFAQDNADDQGEAGREIVVTAQFREQKLQDTPLSITAVDAGLLESRNQTDLSKIAAQAPNVSLNAMGGAYGSSLGASIRGIGQYDFNPAYEPGVGMYVDDVYYATLTGGIFDLLDLERVEILRGPQGTLTGRNSIGGAIKLFSKKPSDENSGMIQAVYGSRQRTDLRASANVVLADGVYGRISGVYKHQNGYVDQVDYGCAHPGNTYGITGFPGSGSDCVMSKLGEVNYAGVRGSLRFNPTPGMDITITADYTHEDRANAAEVVTQTSPSMADFNCGKWCTYASFYLPAGGQVAQGYFMPNRTKFDGWGVSANAKFDLSDSLNIQSITAYRDYRQIWGTDDDFTANPAKAAGGYNDLSFWFFSQELRLNGKIGDLAEFTLGGFYSDQKSVYFTGRTSVTSRRA